ncbi:MAG: HAMP domain-containing sensor histidine kinase [Solirubrobacteraceae bacterium]|jgi:two-component system OmpR family sensor kinase
MRWAKLESLRARLLVGLVVLAAIGLVIAGYVTYREERSFLLGQVNTEVLASFNTIEDQVDYQNGLGHMGEPQGTFPASGDDDGGAPPGGAQGPPDEHQIDPAGTFGEHLDRSGKRAGTPVAANFAAQYPPKLPADIARYVSSPAHPRLFTVRAQGDSSQSYRVLVRHSDIGYGLTVVGVSFASTDATLARLKTVEAIAIASVLAALAILAWVVIKLGLRPLDRIGATAGKIAAGDLSRRVSPADQRTEVGRLGLALNAMLGQIEQAFGKQQESEEHLRRFLADASHELRTPLTSIRGYAELFRRGAADSPEDTAKAMERIEQEAARMGILVEQLLALARLDEMPRSVREPVDLAPLVRDAASDLRAVAPEREVSVKVTPARGRHGVSGDPDGLRQVLANLTTNAIKHTPAGTPIELTLARRDGYERIEVRDHGPGLPDDAQDAVFERFWRAEGGRERGKAGAGLGLAIVAEIVDAHGGRVSARNATEGGASFVIELPEHR